MVQNKKTCNSKIPLPRKNQKTPTLLSTGSIQHRGRPRESSTAGNTTWCTPRVSEWLMVSAPGPFCPLPSGKSSFAWLIWKEDFRGGANSSGQTDELSKVRFSLIIPCRKAPAKGKERSVCWVFLLYFFCSPVIYYFWLHPCLISFTDLFSSPLQRLYIAALESFSKVRTGPFPQSADNAWMRHASQQATRLSKVDSDLLMVEAPLASQITHFATDASDTFLSKVWENERQSIWQYGSGPTKH